MRVKMSKPPPPTASAIGPCPTVIKIVGRPGTGSLPSTIAPPDHPMKILKIKLSLMLWGWSGGAKVLLPNSTIVFFFCFFFLKILKIKVPLMLWGGRVVRRCWVNFQCRGVLLIWITVGQGPIQDMSFSALP